MTNRNAIIASIGAALMAAAFASPHASATSSPGAIAEQLQQQVPAGASTCGAPINVTVTVNGVGGPSRTIVEHVSGATRGHRHHGHRHHRH